MIIPDNCLGCRFLILITLGLVRQTPCNISLAISLSYTKIEGNINYKDVLTHNIVYI